MPPIRRRHCKANSGPSLPFAYARLALSQLCPCSAGTWRAGCSSVLPLYQVRPIFSMSAAAWMWGWSGPPRGCVGPRSGALESTPSKNDILAPAFGPRKIGIESIL
jgi:hypothetical protein